MASDVREHHRRAPSFFQLPLPFCALAVVVALWVIVFFRLGALRHDRHGTFGFDLGIYDQATWLLAFFHRPFITVRGLDVFGHHATPGLWFFAPFYWFGGGPKVLLAMQVLAEASGAFALYLLGRDLLHSRWIGAAFGTLLLLHPTSQWLVWEFFHPEAFAIGPLLFAYWAARTGRWGWFWPCAFVAIAMKEDVALALIVIGILVMVRGSRRIGGAIALLSFAWFVIATRVVIPWRNGVGPFYEQLFGTLGKSPTEVAANLARHPVTGFKIATEPDRLHYYKMMLFPVALAPLASPQTFAIALPMLAINVFTSDGFPFTRDARYHYSAIVLVGVLLATVEAVALLRDQRARAVLVVGLLATSFTTTVLWGPSPLGHKYDKGIWPLQVEVNGAAKDHAMKLLPKGAATSAAYTLVPHLTHRTRIYEFPVPWRDVNWGVHGEHLDNPQNVQWLLIDRSLLDARESALLQSLLRHQFTVRFEREGIVLAQRRAVR
ncbi:MAG: hypothetical protein JWL83_4128 [Actinomycetia bacterium]|jgi:uncharacterized membrane protein|nr:hypothetical protein [Actinomycetes bacterium]